jgi:hypothetical protein
VEDVFHQEARKRELTRSNKDGTCMINNIGSSHSKEKEEIPIRNNNYSGTNQDMEKQQLIKSNQNINKKIIAKEKPKLKEFSKCNKKNTNSNNGNTNNSKPNKDPIQKSLKSVKDCPNPSSIQNNIINNENSENSENLASSNHNLLRSTNLIKNNFANLELTTKTANTINIANKTNSTKAEALPSTSIPPNSFHLVAPNLNSLLGNSEKQIDQVLKLHTDNANELNCLNTDEGKTKNQNLNYDLTKFSLDIMNTQSSQKTGHSYINEIVSNTIKMHRMNF